MRGETSRSSSSSTTLATPEVHETEHDNIPLQIISWRYDGVDSMGSISRGLRAREEDETNPKKNETIPKKASSRAKTPPRVPSPLLPFPTKKTRASATRGSLHYCFFFFLYPENRL